MIIPLFLLLEKAAFDFYFFLDHSNYVAVSGSVIDFI